MDAKGREVRCTALIVEEIFANGYARAVYSVGTSETLVNAIPDAWRVTG